MLIKYIILFAGKVTLSAATHKRNMAKKSQRNLRSLGASHPVRAGWEDGAGKGKEYETNPLTFTA